MQPKMDCGHIHIKHPMKTKTLLIAALLSASVLPSISHAKKDKAGPQAGPQASNPSKVFETLDVDSSGSLSAEEVASNKKLKKRFAKLDKDKDGKLNAKEFQSSQKKKKKSKDSNTSSN